MNIDIKKSWEWDRQYQRLIGDIQKHFPKFELVWDVKNNYWTMKIDNGKSREYVILGNRDNYKDVDLTDLDEFVEAYTKLITIVITYGGTDGYSDGV